MAQSTAMQSWSNLQARRGSVAPFRAAARPTRQQLGNYRCRAAAVVPSEAEAVVVGAGIAGLSAAVNLSKQGIRPLVIEASDGVSPQPPKPRSPKPTGPRHVAPQRTHHDPTLRCASRRSAAACAPTSWTASSWTAASRSS